MIIVAIGMAVWGGFMLGMAWERKKHKGFDARDFFNPPATRDSDDDQRYFSSRSEIWKSRNHGRPN